jgi:hypothetical protein
MRNTLIALAAALCLWPSAPSLAQTAPAAAPSAAPSAAPLVTPRADKPSREARAERIATRKAARRAPAPAPLAEASDEQKAAAAMAHVGDYACEFDQTVKVSNNAASPGYLDVGFKKQSWTMKPVLSSTGALRLEDVKGRMLMIQIANKSMVMDTQIGQRLVDGCQSEQQRAFEKTMTPSESMLGK